jgi:O-antigen/teichoic acid export membrane protein
MPAGAATGRGLRGALQNLSYKGLSLGLERACRLLVIVASARVLGQAAFGRFVFASTVTALLALGTDLGLGVWTTRALARRRGDGKDVVLLGLVLRGVASLPYALALTAIAAFAVRGEARTAVALLGIAALINAFVDHFSAIFRGYERFTDEARLNALRAILTAIAGVVALAVGRSLASVCAGLTAASFGSFAYGLAALGRVQGLRPVSVRAAFAGGLAQVALRQSLPIWLAGLLSVLYFKVDTLFLGSMAGDSELGAYGAAFKLFEGSMIVPAVLLSVTFPQLARRHDDPLVHSALERHIIAALLGLGLLGGAVCFLGGEPLVRIAFGSGFGRAVASLRILALGLPLLFVNFGLTHFLVARDKGIWTLWLSLMMLALTVALDVALIPRGLGPGAAWATVLPEAALTLCCLGAMRVMQPSSRTQTSARGAPRTDQEAA